MGKAKVVSDTNFVSFTCASFNTSSRLSSTDSIPLAASVALLPSTVTDTVGSLGTCIPVMMLPADVTTTKDLWRKSVTSITWSVSQFIGHHLSVLYSWGHYLYVTVNPCKCRQLCIALHEFCECMTSESEWMSACCCYKSLALHSREFTESHEGQATRWVTVACGNVPNCACIRVNLRRFYKWNTDVECEFGNFIYSTSATQLWWTILKIVTDTGCDTNKCYSRYKLLIWRLADPCHNK